MLAMNMIEMKKTERLNSLGENLRLERITRAARSSETPGLPVDDLGMSFSGAALKISGQEQSL
jgi:hypothetical protein